MRTFILTVTAIGLMSAVITTAPSAVSAQAAVKKKTPKLKAKKVDPLEDARAFARMMESGGTVGCPNGPLSGRAAQVADSIRASNNHCAASGSTVTRPTATAPTVSRAWLVGLWVSTSGSCQKILFPTRLRANGTYESFPNAGTWALASGSINFTNSDASSAAIRSNLIRAHRLPGDRLQLGNIIYQRCSTNPDAFAS